MLESGTIMMPNTDGDQGRRPLGPWPGIFCRSGDGQKFVRYPNDRIFAVGFQLIAASFVVVLFSGIALAQSFTARFSVISNTSQAMVKVEGAYLKGANIWSFRNTYGRVIGLGDRIKNLSLADSYGARISVKKVGPGEFEAARSATHFSYEVTLREPANPADGAHISVLNGQYGYLMLADLLPQLQSSGVRVEFQLPESWSIASSVPSGVGDGYAVVDPLNAIFFVGRDLRERRQRISATEFEVVTAGDWPFTGEALIKVAAKIITDHAHHAGFDLTGRVALMLAPFPGLFGSERWSAETRGSNVVVLLGRNSSRNSLLGQLSVVLSHELFHLWVPNALSLDGDYDWFFEGFTLYQALCTAVRLGFIGFQEYLNTLARVYDSYLAASERDRYSLLEASQRRWTTASSLVYEKGMLVAFLYDLKVRKASQNRRSLDDVYHELFRHFPPSARRADGNESIISTLTHEDGDEQFGKRYIVNPGSIELETFLPEFGISVSDAGGGKRLLVAEALNKEQRGLLGALGYRGSH